VKIGIIFQTHPSSGAWSHTRFLRAVGKVLVARGDEVVAFYPRHAQEPDALGTFEGLRTVPVHCRHFGGNSRLQSREMPHRVAPLLDGSYQAIISTADLGAAALFRHARKLGVLSVDWFQGTAPLFLQFAVRRTVRGKIGLAGERFFLPRWERGHIREADVVIAASQKNRRDLQHFYHVPDAKMEVLPNGFDPEPVVTPEERRQARIDLKLPPGPLYASFVGVDAHRKGLDALRESVRAAAPRGARWRVLNVGNEKLENEFEVGYGFLDGAAKRRVLAASDAFVFPTRYEGSPLPIPEAASLALPFVTTPEASIDLGEPGKDYIQVPAGNVGALTEALIALSKDPQALAALGQRGHAAFARWTWEAQATELRRILERGIARVHKG
jgi:glycosyltransferase involved in cell wall biosynthesis